MDSCKVLCAGAKSSTSTYEHSALLRSSRSESLVCNSSTSYQHRSQNLIVNHNKTSCNNFLTGNLVKLAALYLFNQAVICLSSCVDIVPLGQQLLADLEQLVITVGLFITPIIVKEHLNFCDLVFLALLKKKSSTGLVPKKLRQLIPKSPDSSYNNLQLAADDFSKEPPMVPPHLQMTLLNLPAPSSYTEIPPPMSRPQHVVLNHLYMQKGRIGGPSVVALAFNDAVMAYKARKEYKLKLGDSVSHNAIAS
ncbi:hypothetical protein G4B88_007882 [Cannabis sativa]|uniref:Association with the SNF1 complex (ASC) domain-containing protein n=1 Tax=Cannabis sativa TaxID=3483 RepID=A0A7J6DQV0_CANSA|nr:hypothetical protein G4B88_007882 [Cannabis sativa]